VATIAAALSDHRRVGLDTSVFIYHIKATSPYAAPAAMVLDSLSAGAFAGITSVLALMEIAVKPLQLDRPEAADEYELILTNYPHLTIVDVDRTIARRAAELRAIYRLRPADALHLGTSLERGATAFVTNDKDLRRVTDLDVILLEDFVDR
jgi:predicted nucleic acid-binding protein